MYYLLCTSSQLGFWVECDTSWTGVIPFSLAFGPCGPVRPFSLVLDLCKVSLWVFPRYLSLASVSSLLSPLSNIRIFSLYIECSTLLHWNMPARVRTYLLGTLPSAGVLGIFLPGQHVPNLLVLNNYSKPSSLAHAYVLGSKSYSKTALLEYLYAHRPRLKVMSNLKYY